VRSRLSSKSFCVEHNGGLIIINFIIVTFCALKKFSGDLNSKPHLICLILWAFIRCEKCSPVVNSLDMTLYRLDGG